MDILIHHESRRQGAVPRAIDFLEGERPIVVSPILRRTYASTARKTAGQWLAMQDSPMQTRIT